VSPLLLFFRRQQKLPWTFNDRRNGTTASILYVHFRKSFWQAKSDGIYLLYWYQVAIAVELKGESSDSVLDRLVIVCVVSVVPGTSMTRLASYVLRLVTGIQRAPTVPALPNKFRWQHTLPIATESINNSHFV